MLNFTSFLRATICSLTLVAVAPALGSSSPDCSVERGATLFEKCAVCHNNDNTQTLLVIAVIPE